AEAEAIGIFGDVKSASPAPAVGSGANTEFGGVSLLVVTVVKVNTPRGVVLVQPAGSDGAATPSKFSVTPGIPSTITLVKLRGPRVLFTLNVRVRAEPHGVAAGTV